MFRKILTKYRNVNSKIDAPDISWHHIEDVGDAIVRGSVARSSDCIRSDLGYVPWLDLGRDLDLDLGIDRDRGSEILVDSLSWSFGVLSPPPLSSFSEPGVRILEV